MKNPKKFGIGLSIVVIAAAVLYFTGFGGIFTPKSAEAVSGAIWTTKNDCGDESQDINHYNIGEVVYINGANFDAGTYDWEIRGQPGQSSADPNIVVASGQETVDSSGKFCFLAYTVQNNDDGEYKVKFGNKQDNYRVDGESGQDLPVISGFKFNDLNMDGVWDGDEPPLNNWEICLEVSGQTTVVPPANINIGLSITGVIVEPVCVLTGDGEWPDGYYEFVLNIRGNVTLTETLQEGWGQSAPASGNHVVNVESPIVYANNDFGNYILPFCGDGVVNQETEQCDGAAGVTEHYTCTESCSLEYIPYCGDGVKNGTEECDGTDGITGSQTCSTDCKIVEPTVTATPVITLTKLDTPDPIAAGADLTYTLNFTISNAPVTGLVMTDEIPANTTFVSASDPGIYDATTNKVTWNYGDLAAGNYVATLKVTVYSPLANGTKITNTAIIDSNETDPAVTATAETTTSTAPILTMDKLVDNASPLAGDTINYTVKITNSGTDAATNVKLTDTLPAGLTFVDNGTTAMTYSFGNIESGKTVATTYAVKIDSAIAAGTYTNSAIVTADNHADLTDSVDVAVSVPIVLGEETEEPAPEVKVLGEELPETGANILFTILSGLALVGSGFILRRKAQ